MSKIKLLFLCTGNSCRSQMAEGWTRHLKDDAIEVFSAGVQTHGVNPKAVKVMAEAGVDISSHRSQLLSEFQLEDLDVIVTVCGHAQESCPVLPPNIKTLHAGFDDPPRMEKEVEGEEAKLDCYRKVRDDIRAFVATLPEALP